MEHLLEFIVEHPVHWYFSIFWIGCAAFWASMKIKLS